MSEVATESAAGEATAASGIPSTTRPIATSAETPKPTPPTANAKAITHSLEDAHLEISNLLGAGKVFPEDVPAIQAILKEYVGLKEKVDKLKSLLGRSAKAQRETKVELEASQKRLSQALREIERLNKKLETLQSRPTHCKFSVKTSLISFVPAVREHCRIILI